jgi:hypothetical protein
LTGGNNTGGEFMANDLFGDAVILTSQTAGGDDTLIGGNSANGLVTNELHGDAFQLADSALGGDDVLIAGTQSGSGNVVNNMWGDAQLLSGSGAGGNDTFVFDGSFGDENYVWDFHQGEDILDINGLSIEDLDINLVGSDTRINPTGDADNMVTLVGFTDTLTAEDFGNYIA